MRGKRGSFERFLKALQRPGSPESDFAYSEDAVILNADLILFVFVFLP